MKKTKEYNDIKISSVEDFGENEKKITYENGNVEIVNKDEYIENNENQNN